MWLEEGELDQQVASSVGGMGTAPPLQVWGEQSVDHAAEALSRLPGSELVSDNWQFLCEQESEYDDC